MPSNKPWTTPSDSQEKKIGSKILLQIITRAYPHKAGEGHLKRRKRSPQTV